MDRQPVVAGQFYPGNSNDLAQDVRKYTSGTKPISDHPTILAMVPHAGYVYSGAVAGETIARANLAETVILLGPNHSGYGELVALWPDGKWVFPGGALTVDQELAANILRASPFVASDYDAHIKEHSLEVQLPFLHAKHPATRIVPICVADPRQESLLALGSALARVISKAKKPISIVVSSDMSHYISANQAKQQDSLAINQILALSPEGLFRTVRDNGISMCGIFPMTMGLQAACNLGATKALEVRYATSGDVNRDYAHVVGYAGIIVE